MAIENQLIVRTLGQVEYESTWHRMQAFTQQRDESTADEIWLLEHDRVFTQGQAGKPEHLLHTGDIPVVQVDRGGQVTYHGPGQQIVYLLLDLRRHKLGVRELVSLMEQTVVDVLAQYDVKAYPKPDAPGVYVDEAKICSLGLRIRRGCSFHGFALNVDMDLEPFLRINPCGYAGLHMTQLKAYQPKVQIAEVREKLLTYLIEKIGYSEVTRTTRWED